MSSSDMRSTTDITVDFTAPNNDAVTDADYVALELPFFWMGVDSWADGSATPSATLSLGTATTTGTKTTVAYAAVAGTVSHVSGCNMVFTLATAATKVAKNGLYRLTVSSVPTAWHATWGPMMNMGSLSVGLGKAATGGVAWSSAQFFNPLAAQAAKKGLTLLEF